MKSNHGILVLGLSLHSVLIAGSVDCLLLGAGNALARGRLGLLGWALIVLTAVHLSSLLAALLGCGLGLGLDSLAVTVTAIAASSAGGRGGGGLLLLRSDLLLDVAPRIGARARVGVAVENGQLIEVDLEYVSMCRNLK